MFTISQFTDNKISLCLATLSMLLSRLKWHDTLMDYARKRMNLTYINILRAFSHSYSHVKYFIWFNSRGNIGMLISVTGRYFSILTNFTFDSLQRGSNWKKKYSKGGGEKMFQPLRFLKNELGWRTKLETENFWRTNRKIFFPFFWLCLEKLKMRIKWVCFCIEKIELRCMKIEFSFSCTENWERKLIFRKLFIKTS